MRVSLIGTVHEARGLVTVDALLAILERVQPEVIFAEIPSTHVDRWKDGSHGTLESITVARYAAGRPLDTVPVDLPKPEESFFHEYKEMFCAIERTSPELRRLLDFHAEQTRRGGFAYLNSDECIEAYTAINREQRDTIEYIGSQRLRATYDVASDTMERRDMEMLRNIRAYCAHTDRKRGAFLVGAAHRRSLIEKTSVADETSGQIEWDLSGFL
jgi:hypothetical protein